VGSINDGGMAIELADLLIEQGSKGHAFSV
jgi:hypothetical protein